jgi:hypothetical protein
MSLIPNSAFMHAYLKYQHSCIVSLNIRRRPSYVKKKLLTKVEMRNAKSEEWVEVGESDGPKRFFRQSGLTKGEKYSFRVR